MPPGSSDDRSFLTKLCLGEGPLWLNCVTWPFVLFFNAFWIYVFPCLGVLIGRFTRLVCYPFCQCCWVYTDKSFEGEAAIGCATEDRTRYLSNATPDTNLPASTPGSSSGAAAGDIKWERASLLAAVGKKMKVYEEGIKPSDLCQGAVGDCWLVAALASAAEHPACIRRAFLTREANSRGKYRIRLFDGQKKKWVIITVDDRIPCKGTAPVLNTVFMKPVGNEMWAILLEKAFAKFCGSYKALDGGWAPWAWQALTGDHVFMLKSANAGKLWKRLDFKCDVKDKKDKRAAGFWSTDEEFKPDEAWVLIQKYIRADALLAASGGKDMSGSGGGGGNTDGLNGEAVDDNGLVGTHAYSILDARELGLIPGLSGLSGLLGKTKLIRLRNPWGQFEWKGAWSDGSKEWAENPIVKMRLRPKDEDDGSFWMPWEDFSRIFKRVDICDRTTKRDLRLEVNEDLGSCGLVAGCLGGLADFVLCCKGLRVIYGGHVSTGETRSAKRGCCGMVGGPLGGAPDDGLEIAV